MHAEILPLKPELANTVKLQTGADLARTQYLKVFEGAIMKGELILHNSFCLLGRNSVSGYCQDQG